MGIEEKFAPKFEIDSIIDESEIIRLEMKPLDSRGIKYELYSKGFYVYYFKRIERNTLQLCCCTSKESYYFSNTPNTNQDNDQVGILNWLFA